MKSPRKFPGRGQQDQRDRYQVSGAALKNKKYADQGQRSDQQRQGGPIARRCQAAQVPTDCGQHGAHDRLIKITGKNGKRAGVANPRLLRHDPGQWNAGIQEPTASKQKDLTADKEAHGDEGIPARACQTQNDRNQDQASVFGKGGQNFIA